jgi:iron complex outermembrane receptor protein
MSPKLRASIRRALFAAGAMTAAVTVATAQEMTEEIAEIVIVTGSYIRGTAEDAALPVDVVTADDLAAQGSPTMVDIIKQLPAVQNTIGESNQFGTQNTAGSSSINLRGLGATRTLVLLNGRRLTSSPVGAIGVDTNLLPMSAIGRIEVLKDGAAATYGSDAIAGVVNFITKEDYEGLSLNGSYSYIDGSDGDAEAGVTWGWKNDRSDLLLSADYRHRSMLPTTERPDWAVRSRTVNPQGGWSGASNPGAYSQGASGTTPLMNDPACTALGGVLTTSCQFQYIVFDNIVEEEDHYHAFASYNLDITDNVAFHAEAMYGMHDVPEEHVSPSYAPNKSATNGFPLFYVPLSNPGIQSLLNNPTALTAAQRTALQNATAFGQPGVAVSGLSWRPLAQGGNPTTGDNGAQWNSRKFDAFRLSTGLNGTFGPEINWDVGGTYMENTGEISTPEVIPGRLALALRGLGGPNCTGTTAGANGCQWFNPTSTAVGFNPATGAPNTVTYDPASANDPNLIRWMSTPATYESTTELMVFDAVLSGELGWTLPGGAIGWAAGTQYRENKFERVIVDPVLSSVVSPCAQTPITGDTSCTNQSGALGFNGSQDPTQTKQDMYAVFGEMSFPILDSLQAQLAVRYEDYGQGIGSTTNPKLSMRWQALDWLALRGSAGTTFRAPPQTSLEGNNTTLAFTLQTATSGQYLPYVTYGNPNLKPETADTFNVGFIVQVAGFSATVDYWNFVFEDALGAEVGTQLVTAFFGNGGSNPQCNNPAYDALETRFDFGGNACAIGNLISTRANQINAQSETEISGVDVGLAYQFDSVLGGDLVLGIDGTYNIEYQIGNTLVEGIEIETAQDVIGTRGSRAGTQPEWKAAAYADFGTDIHNVRLTARYIDGVTDVRPAIAVGSPGKEVDEFLTYDATYFVRLPWDTTLSASVFNITDEDPSLARLDLSYDPFIGNPLGRYWKIGFTKSFQ